MQSYGDNFIPIIPVDYQEHTPEHPFCSTDSCPCHEDPDNIAAVNQAYQDGLVSADDATALFRAARSRSKHMKPSYAQPRPPDMLPNGLPHITAFRSSRARQVTYAPGDYQTEPVSRKRRFRIGKRTIGFLVLCLIVTGLVIAWQQIAVPRWTSTQDQWKYGSSRITQLDADVGHDSLEHFVAEYAAGAIVVIEIPFAHPSNAHVYTLTGMVTNGTTPPVILLSTERDSCTGRLDLAVMAKGTSFQTVLYNTGSSFSQTGA